MRKKWEYQIIVNDTSTSSLVDKINEEGKEGWELVCVTPQTHEYYEAAYLKREIEEVGYDR